MELKLDVKKPYGVVLEGGGAKGAYQIGAWKALREAGVEITGIAGASVGALNGALICMDDLEGAEYLWENISYSKVMDIDDTFMERIQKGKLKGLTLKEVGSNILKIVMDGGFDITPLRRLIAETIDEEEIRDSKRELFITTFSVDQYKEEVLDVKSMPEGQVGDALLASAYFPAFKNEKLDGKRYIDGGGINNVPVNVLIEKGYKDIIIIRIYGLGFDTEKVAEIPGDVIVSHIAPRQSLGGTLEFDSKKAKRNLLLGYYDAQRFLYDLSGRVYYFDTTGTEGYYFNKLMGETELTKPYVTSQWEEGALQGYRAYTEQIFPELAKNLKLKADWDYKDLYLSLLEAWAKELRISRFQIYTPEEMLEKIRKEAEKT